MTREIHGKYFYGNEISPYGQEHGRVDYRTLAKAFNAVMNNSIITNTAGIVGEWELFSGADYDDESDEYVDIFQYFIIDANGAEILQEWAPDEIVYYNDELGIYVWGVTHWGTSWDYVLTEIPVVA